MERYIKQQDSQKRCQETKESTTMRSDMMHITRYCCCSLDGAAAKATALPGSDQPVLWLAPGTSRLAKPQERLNVKTFT